MFADFFGIFAYFRLYFVSYSAPQGLFIPDFQK